MDNEAKTTVTAILERAAAAGCCADVWEEACEFTSGLKLSDPAVMLAAIEAAGTDTVHVVLKHRDAGTFHKCTLTLFLCNVGEEVVHDYAARDLEHWEPIIGM